jgi:acetyl-CoA carboxylase carboxyltransferase component
MLEVAKEQQLPVIMYTEGGGGRPGDTDVQTQIGGLHLMTWVAWSELSGMVPRIAVANGYNFAGNAALFGGADIKIATKESWIGMAGPAMIEGGGLGSFAATDIGPIDVQSSNGVVDIVADDEAHATALAKKVLSYFQGPIDTWHCSEQAKLRTLLPEDRRFTYDVRNIITSLADKLSFTELRRDYGSAIITGFIRIEGKAFGVICNDCKVLGGAIDAVAAEKAGEFMTLCNDFGIPLLSLCDTPGFMVGPDSEKAGAARRMGSMFTAGAKMRVPIVTIFLRKAYGLGAMAMAGGSFAKSIYSAAWPTGEFGAMGLEGAVRLGFKKELEAAATEAERDALFEELLAAMYERGKATEAAAFLEIDGVIDPADTRRMVVNAVG